MNNKTKKLTVLSLDGGGIRGIVSCIILKYLEDKITELEGEPIKIGDYFDFVSGTSTGGLIGALILLPKSKNSYFAKHSIVDALNIYLGEGNNVFSKTFWTILKNPFSFFKSTFPTVVIEHQLKKIFKNHELKDLIRPTSILAYDTVHRIGKSFNSAEAISPFRNFYLRDVCRATSAAPTLFEPAFIKSFSGNEFCLIDGGVFANNPTFFGLTEARKINYEKFYNDPLKPQENCRLEDMLVVSIGNGSKPDVYNYDDLKEIDRNKWLNPLIDITLSSNVDITDYQIRQIYDMNNIKFDEVYFRLNPRLKISDLGMDNVNEQNIKNLIQEGKSYVKHNQEKLNKLAQMLIENKPEIQKKSHL